MRVSRFSVRSPGESVDEQYVTLPVRVAAAWAWRVLVIAAAVVVFGVVVAYLRIVVIPLLIAGLLTALLEPVVNRLVGWRWPRVLAVIVALLVLFGAVTAMVWVIATQVSGGLDDLSVRTQESYGELKTWLYDSPLHVTDDKIAEYIAAVRDMIQTDSSTLLSGVISVGSTAGHVVTGTLLTIFSLIFLLADGRRIFSWSVRLFPQQAQQAVAGAGHAGWKTVSSYVRVQIFVAFVDAVGISVVAAILQLPMLLPIGLLVFLASFVPFVGAIASGFFVCLIALVYGGLWPAVIMLGGVIVVQQLESHVLQPFIMGSAVRVHPLGVVLAVTIGALLAGIPGTLFAVPIVAAMNVMIGYVRSGCWRAETERSVAAEGTTDD